MTNRLELNWKVGGFVDEQRYYCSETPIDPENLPTPKAVLAGDVRSYVDAAVDVGKTYYVAVGSVKNGVEKISDVVAVNAGGDTHWSNVVSLLRFESGVVDDTGRIWNTVGSPVVQSGALVLDGSSGLTTSSNGFDFETGDFTIEAFVTQSSPNSQWREIFIANSGYGINVMLYDKKLATGREGVANDYVSTQEVAQNELKHIAVSRNSGVLRGFIDGNKIFEGAYNESFTSSAIHSLGSKSNGSNGFVGAIESFRVTKAVGRYTANFTPEPFKND